jgi:3-hydroxyisobutyrate dehydrogenase-like beta-hydroxyacid dehydrogenase
MGSNMAANLLAAGYSVVGYDTVPGEVQRLREQVGQMLPQLQIKRGASN